MIGLGLTSRKPDNFLSQMRFSVHVPFLEYVSSKTVIAQSVFAGLLKLAHTVSLRWKFSILNEICQVNT